MMAKNIIFLIEIAFLVSAPIIMAITGYLYLKKMGM